MLRVSGCWAVALLEAKGFSVFVYDLKADFVLVLLCPFCRRSERKLGLPLRSGQRVIQPS